MKKIVFLLMGIVIMAYSCSKEEEKTTATQNDKGVREYLDIDTTEAKILDFIHQLENPDEGIPLLAEDVVWNIEAALNYNYTNVDQFNYVEKL